MAAPLYVTGSGRLFHAGQILISVVGLPARGKTHISRSLDRYLRWLGVKAKVFSLGDHRRLVLGKGDNLPEDYFSTEGNRSEKTEAMRKQIKDDLIQKITSWLTEEGGQVAIYDANNATIKQREELRTTFKPLGVHVFFIESICNDEKIINSNIKAVKLSSPDYRSWDPEKALSDYWRRIREHEKVYQTIEQPSFPYVKIINVGERIVVNNIEGYLQSRIVFFLMNIHNRFRTIWLARSGRSEIEHSYRADSSLAPEGKDYAQQLKKFLLDKRRDQLLLKRKSDPDAKQRQLVVWTSARRRCVETTEPFRQSGYRIAQFTQMSEINPGVIDGMSSEEIQEAYPEEFARSKAEPFSHRYPRAESYHDLSVRLEPVIFNLEREQNDVLIIAHASVLRCLFSYLKGLGIQDIPKMDIQRGDLIEITPSAYGITSRTHHFSFEHDHLGPGAGDSYQYGSPASAHFLNSPRPASSSLPGGMTPTATARSLSYAETYGPISPSV